MSAPVRALREWGQCIRGDWAYIDGRSARADLHSLADAMEGGKGSEWTLEQWRADLGMCPSGAGHWTRHCSADPGYGCGNEPSGW